MALAIKIEEQWHGGQRVHAVGTIEASGSYVANGDTLDLSGIRWASTPPTHVDIYGIAGYVYCYNPGTKIANGKMLVYEAGADGAALDERAVAAYPSAVTGDTIRFHAIFKKK